jgi:hypothetical protein
MLPGTGETAHTLQKGDGVVALVLVVFVVWGSVFVVGGALPCIFERLVVGLVLVAVPPNHTL